MCGIAGVHGWVDEEALENMLATITHRGPDDEGRYVDADGPMMMGARRLSIVDLAKGNQPVYNEDDTVAVVFNGEIYNYEGLRERLEAKGHRFSTDCDTEILVHLWEEYSEEMPAYLNGMFAFSIWDEGDETLFLARDRLGIKPLYYADTPDGFVWGSELPVLLEAGVNRTLDENAVYNYFSLRYSPRPRTLIQGVRKLRPGSSLRVTRNDIHEQEYWRLESQNVPTDRDTLEAEVRDRLRDSIEMRLMADVPVGAFLSGGLDSSIVVGVMSELLDEDVKTFSIGFENESFDESAEAAFVADYFGTDHNEYTVNLSSMDIFSEIATYFGEPLADPAVVPTMLLSKHASEDVKVILTGEGSDELFLGYDHYDMVSSHREWAKWLPSPVFNAAELASKHFFIANGYFRYLSSLRDDTETLLNWTIGYGTGPNEYMQTDLTPEKSGLRRLTQESFGDAESTIKRMERLYINHWLPDDLLYKLDHSSMASSLEARVPFLDHKLVEFMYSVPTQEKLAGGPYKPLLNRAMADIVPDRIRERRKQGFSVPIGEWLRSDNPSIRRWLDPDTIGDTPYLDPGYVSKLAEHHRTEKANHRNALWRILNYVAWYHTIVAESEVASQARTLV